MKKHLQFLITTLIVASLQSTFAQSPFVFKNIDVNNINAIISPSSDLFWDFTNPTFEVPKGGQTHTIFSGALWIGGVDGSGNVHLGAQTYRQTGSDFWPGPIDTIHFGNMGATNYLDYNEPWKLSQAEIQAHILNYTSTNYVVPQNIAEWPGFDTTVQRVISPFADYNGNGIYDPENGDYPYILGDQSVYAVFNDINGHTETTCDTGGFEIHREFFAFDAPTNAALNNSIFSRYTIKNFSLTDYQDLYMTLWTDFDLGDASDDYIGTDMNLDMSYAYNADSIDGLSQYGYGANPPAMGVYFLDQSLSASMVYENINNSPVGNPSGCIDFYNLMKSIWLDNQPVTYGADGRDPSNAITTFMFPGTTDPVNYPLYGEWSESTAGNPPNDRRVLSSIGPFNLVSKGVITFDVGYTYARATSGGPLASVAQLQSDVAGLRVMYDNGTLTSIPGIQSTSSVELSVYPNPATELVTIKNTGISNEFNVIIRDAIGRIMYKKDKINDPMHHVDIRSFSKGMYVISLMQNQKSSTKKLIVK